jgi:hypothetical protein
MRAAILLGVSEYKNLPALPACTKDLEAVEGLLRKTSHYEYIFSLCRPEPAAQVKNLLLNFLAGVPKGPEEVLFYFSGHGDHREGELHFLLHDFDESRPKQTSLENSEVDLWLRQLMPDVAVKVLDCCNSGVAYIKSTDAFEAALEKSTGGFKNCYFFFSSDADQVSYADRELSHFTRAFLSGANARPDGPIRYKDLIDAIADQFSSNASQRPRFVVQAEMREIFFTQTPMIRDFISSLVAPPQALKAETEGQVPPTSIHDLIAVSSTEALTKPEAQQILEVLHEAIQGFSIHPTLAEVYEVEREVAEISDDDLPNPEVVGRWIAKKGADFFAVPNLEEREPHSLAGSEYLSSVMGLSPSSSLSFRTKAPAIIGFFSTTGLSNEFGRVRLVPRYPNVPGFETGALVLFSHKRAQVFSYLTQLVDTSWDRRDFPESVRWRTLEFSSPFVTNSKAHFSRLFSRLNDHVTRYLDEVYRPKPDESPTE